MLFGAMRLLQDELRVTETPGVERRKYEYADNAESLEDMLRSPMTLSQGAAIMNRYRRVRKGGEMVAKVQEHECENE